MHPLVSFLAKRIVARELENFSNLVKTAQLAKHRRDYSDTLRLLHLTEEAVPYDVYSENRRCHVMPKHK